MEQVDDSYFSALDDSDQDLFPSFCKICMEHPPTSSMFFSINCSHSFCRNCITRYVATKINDNVSALKCPEDNCNGLLEPEQCQEIVPKEVFERWGSALRESTILGSNKFSYCPFKDCSALLKVDEGEGSLGQSECPSCCRLFCRKCNVAWHDGLSCEEFEELGVDERGAEDLKLIEIAKSKKWMRCPQCKYYVEKTQGCLHVTCRALPAAATAAAAVQPRPTASRRPDPSSSTRSKLVDQIHSTKALPHQPRSTAPAPAPHRTIQHQLPHRTAPSSAQLPHQPTAPASVISNTTSTSLLQFW